MEGTPISPLAKLREVRDNLPSVSPENTKVREELLVEARSLTKALERDDNLIERICFQVMSGEQATMKMLTPATIE